MGRSPVKGVLPKWLKGFTATEGNSESKNGKGPKSRNEKKSSVILKIKEN
jgi:hypothetical protein